MQLDKQRQHGASGMGTEQYAWSGMCRAEKKSTLVLITGSMQIAHTTSSSASSFSCFSGSSASSSVSDSTTTFLDFLAFLRTGSASSSSMPAIVKVCSLLSV